MIVLPSIWLDKQNCVIGTEIGGTCFSENSLGRLAVCFVQSVSQERIVWEWQKRVENKSGRLVVTSVFAALTSFSCEKAWEKKKRRGFMSGRKELQLVCDCSSTRARTPYSQSATFVADMRYKLTFSTFLLLFLEMDESG